jgi:hypothetical protein
MCFRFEGALEVLYGKEFGVGAGKTGVVTINWGGRPLFFLPLTCQRERGFLLVF